jgi:ATP-dependent RNA helicase DDX19/DBP5
VLAEESLKSLDVFTCCDVATPHPCSSPALVRGIYSKGWEKPSKIQAEALPLILDSKRPNMRGQAKSGSGKTGAFSLGMLSAVDPSLNAVQALCLSPTRELAQATADVCKTLGSEAGISVLPVVGGVQFSTQITAHVVVATVGKLKNLKTRRRPLIDLSRVKVFVLDEAEGE